MSDLDDKLRDILKKEVDESIQYGEGVGADYYGISFDDIITKTKQAFADTLHMPVEQMEYIGGQRKDFDKRWNAMTGTEWYERFKAEYHNKADWIAADEAMGDDAEHDVLLCARLAAGLDKPITGPIHGVGVYEVDTGLTEPEKEN